MDANGMKAAGYVMKGMLTEMPEDLQAMIKGRIADFQSMMDPESPADLLAFGIFIADVDWDALDKMDMDVAEAKMDEEVRRYHQKMNSVPEGYHHQSYLQGYEKGWNDREAEMMASAEAADDGPMISLERVLNAYHNLRESAEQAGPGDHMHTEEYKRRQAVQMGLEQAANEFATLIPEVKDPAPTIVGLSGYIPSDMVDGFRQWAYQERDRYMRIRETYLHNETSEEYRGARKGYDVMDNVIAVLDSHFPELEKAGGTD